MVQAATRSKRWRTQEDANHDISLIGAKLGRVWSPEEEAILYCQNDEILGSGGERGGKSFTASDFLNVRFFQGELYWIAGLDYETCRPEFEYCVEALKALGAVQPRNINFPATDQCSMTLGTGAVIKTISCRNWTKIGREAPDGIVICEVAQLSYEMYKRLRNRTTEKRGWLLGTGTFEGSLGWYPELWKQYQLPNQSGISFSIPTWSNLAVFPGGRDDPIIKQREKELTPEEFMERFGGVPCPPRGLVLPQFKSIVHVQEVEYNDNSPVYLWIDPGWAGAYAVEVVQIIGDDVFVVDEIYEQHLVTDQIIEMCQRKPWWKQVKGGAVDIAAKQHQAMPAVVEVWRDKAGLNLACQKVEINEGIERFKSFLLLDPVNGNPHFVINTHCYGLISELGGCPNPFTGETACYRWRQNATGETVGTTPEDKNNHAIKAVIYGLIDRFGFVRRNVGDVGRVVAESPFL